jgi:hypothetical protein
VESQPVVLNGTVRHRLRLQAADAGSPQGDAEHEPENALQRGPVRQ